MGEGSKTNYETSLDYSLDPSKVAAGAGRLEQVLGNLSRAAGASSAAVGGIGKSVLGGVGMAFGHDMISGLKGIASHALAANMELGSMRKGIAGGLVGFQNWKEGVDIMTRVKASMRDARQVTDDLDAAESELAIDMGELAGGFRFLSGTLIQQYGASTKQAVDFTTDVAAAAKVLGTDVQSAGFMVTRLLETRNLRGVDPLTTYLRGAIKNTKELKSMAPDKLFATIGDKLHGLRGAAVEMSDGMGGAIFRIKDFFSDTVRDIGAPAFAYIAEKIKEWSKELQATGEGGKKVYEIIGSKLLTNIKKIVEFGEQIAKHWKEIAFAIGAIKMTSLLSDGARWAQTLAGAEGSAKGIAGALSGIKNLGPLVVALEIGGAAGAWLASQLNEGGAWGDTAAGKQFQRFSATVAQHLPGGMTDEDMRRNRIEAMRMKESSAEGLRAMRKKHGLDRETGLPTPATLKYGDPSTGKPLDFARFGLGPPKPDLPDTKDLVRRGRPINNFYGDIKVQQTFKEADPDNVMVRMINDVNNQAESRLMSPLSPAFGGRVG